MAPNRSTPPLHTVVAAVGRIATVAPEVAESARWLWPPGYQRTVTGERVGGRSSGVNRPTGTIIGHGVYVDEKRRTRATAQHRVRENVNTAVVAVMAAAAQLEGALVAARGHTVVTDYPEWVRTGQHEG